jgi:predicted RecA/RadA family phage recombinase
MRNYKGSGKLLDFVNGTGSTILAGTMVVIGVRVAVTAVDIAAGATGTVSTRGVFAVTKKAGDTPAFGALLYWDATNHYLTTTATSNTLAGYCAANGVASGDATVNVSINA